MGKRRKFPCSFGHCWGHGECQLSRRFQFKTFVLSLPPQPRRKQEEVGVKTAQISRAGEGGFLRLGKSSFPTRPGKWKSKGPSQTCLLAPNFVSTTVLFFFFFPSRASLHPAGKPQAPQNPALPLVTGSSLHVPSPFHRQERQPDSLTRYAGLGAAISPTQTCTGKNLPF